MRLTALWSRRWEGLNRAMAARLSPRSPGRHALGDGPPILNKPAPNNGSSSPFCSQREKSRLGGCTSGVTSYARLNTSVDGGALLAPSFCRIFFRVRCDVHSKQSQSPDRGFTKDCKGWSVSGGTGSLPGRLLKGDTEKKRDTH